MADVKLKTLIVALPGFKGSQFLEHVYFIGATAEGGLISLELLDKDENDLPKLNCVGFTMFDEE